MALMKNNSKRGSVTIFICIFFVSLVILIFAFTGAAKKMAVSSSADALCELWAESILAEYDLNLQKRYNLFGFYGYPDDVRKKMDFYAGKSFDKKKYINYGGSTCSLYDYSLVNCEIFKEQVVKAGMLAFTEKFIAPEREIKKVAGHTTPTEEVLLHNLPSEGSEKSFSVSSAVDMLKDSTSLKEVLKSGGDGYFTNKYISAYFKCRTGGETLGKTWFQGEREYILCGKNSDEKNFSSVRRKIVSVREGMNLLFLHRNPSMRAQAMAAAELLSPGPAAVATYEGILAAWALAESYNDYNLMINGHKVPLMKSEASWAVKLSHVLENREEGCIYTGIDRGETYEDYLRFFTGILDEHVCLLRMMDLIQINMRYMYYDSFLLKEYNGGLSVSVEVNGETHEVSKKY